MIALPNQQDRVRLAVWLQDNSKIDERQMRFGIFTLRDSSRYLHASTSWQDFYTKQIIFK